MTPLKRFTGFIFTVLLAACSTTSVPTSSELNTALMDITGEDGRACVRVQDISGYGVLNDSTVSVSSKFRKHYLMVTAYRCSELQTALGAAFKGSFTEFCGRRDSIVSGGQRCPVQGVFEFENREAAFRAFDEAENRIDSSREQKN